MSQQTLIDPTIEQVLQENIFPDLKKGRENFDLPHTQAVVHWMKWLITNHPAPQQLNSKVLITAAYGHDWGYIGLFEGVNSDDPAVIAARKPAHMQIGAEKIQHLLESKLADFFSNDEIERVTHLVLMHDKVEELKDEDELMIMEADTLGMLDSDRVKPTFTKADTMIFIEQEIKQRRLPKFPHQYAVDITPNLIQKRIDFYN